MVYFYTSSNVKMIRNIMSDYEATDDIAPYEYMASYIEKCPESTDETKLTWIAETFLGIQKHEPFLKETALRMGEDLSDEDRDYFMIILFAVTFQIEPKEMDMLYKCLFNLSRSLLSTFTKYLSNNEVLPFITQIAQQSYDTNYVTVKIISPLFTWQPYISEMGHSYAEFLKKVENRKIKLPTIPVQPNVLRRMDKETSLLSPQPILPPTPPNSLGNKNRKMLTKSVIDNKLKTVHEKHRQKATKLLNCVKNNNHHYAQDKTEDFNKKIMCIKSEIENSTSLPPRPRQKNLTKSPSAPVKENLAAVKRLNKRVQQEEQAEMLWLENIVKNCSNVVYCEQFEENQRQKQNMERLIDIEKKHLQGQISREEAILAKKKLKEANKKKYEEFLKEKEVWNEAIEKWRKSQIERNNKAIAKLSMIELNILEAKNGITKKNKENAEQLKKEGEYLQARALKVKNDELERRIQMIKEIKVLAMIAKKARVPKVIDLTESSGVGLLCEMSLAELQERLDAVKMGFKDELDRKKMQIKNENAIAKQELEEEKSNIRNHLSEREVRRKHKKSHTKIEFPKEITDLKKKLEEKRKLRIKLSS